MEIGFATSTPSLRLNNVFDIIMDSRSADHNVSANTTAGLTGVGWFNWANSLNGHRMVLGINNGISGARSDQSMNGRNSAGALVRTGIEGLLASPAGWAIFGYPIVNDLTAAAAGNYTDLYGTPVTLATVAAVTAASIQLQVRRLLAVGKRVILTPETGATNLSAAQIGQLHEFNLRMRAFAEATDGVYMWDPRPALWAAGTATTIAFKAGALRTGDPTHFSILGGMLAGQVFNTFIASLMTVSDFGPASLSDNATTNPRQMTPNPLFNTLTGGTVSGGLVLSSGNVPSGYEIKGASTSSVSVTSAAEANGFGNAVTMAFTTTAADVVQIIGTAPALAAWNLTDTFQQQIDMDVAAGSAAAFPYLEMQVNTDQGTTSYYAMYTDATYAPFPTTAYSVRLRSQPGVVRAGSTTKGFLSPRLGIRFTGAGNITLTLRRPSFERRF